MQLNFHLLTKNCEFFLCNTDSDIYTLYWLYVDYKKIIIYVTMVHMLIFWFPTVPERYNINIISIVYNVCQWLIKIFLMFLPSFKCAATISSMPWLFCHSLWLLIRGYDKPSQVYCCFFKTIAWCLVSFSLSLQRKIEAKQFLLWMDRAKSNISFINHAQYNPFLFLSWDTGDEG